jgi:hypothetical protein
MVLGMAGELFIRSNDQRDLEVFGPYLFGLLDIRIEEIRNSDHVAGGRYLIGKACGLRLRLEMADDAMFSSYDFLLSFEPWVHERGSSSIQLDTFADVVARYLAQEGLAVARPTAFGTFNQTSVEYEPPTKVG